MADPDPETVVPSAIGPERKRVLGVLAQRRGARKRQQRQHQVQSDVVQQLPLTPSTLQWGSTDNSYGQSTSILFDENGSNLFNPQSDDPTIPFLDPQAAHDQQLFIPTTCQFSDDRILQTPVLKLVRTAMEMATRLGCETTIWDPTTSHLLPRDIATLANLPPDFHPVEAQIMVPHHPLLDILPWPQVRSKLILLFSMPAYLRPPAARDALALVKLVYDLEDESEGCRILGEDGFSAASWEVGQKVFTNWWWAFDREIIQHSNALRRVRGVQALTLEQAYGPNATN